MNDQPDPSSDTGENAGRPHRATAAVYGAGVSGMTVAHELVLRGFRVIVVEPTRRTGPDGNDRLTVGGLAASQFDCHERARVFPGSSPNRPSNLRLVGEHGYRFFPSYYQHLFDTMGRTPVYDNEGRPERRTTLDNVRPCTTQAATGPAGHPLLAISRRPLTGPLVANDLAQEMRGAGFLETDVLYMAERMAHYMTSSMARRKDYERLSSYEFFKGVDQKGGNETIQYSPAFERQLQYMPKVLAAFDAQYGDARTNIDSFAQMMLNLLTDLPKIDGILDGPTSTAWLDHWRMHIEELGAVFVAGHLDTLRVDDDGVVHAEVDWDDEATDDLRDAVGNADYHVVATDAVAAERVTRDLPRVGVPRGLDGYTTTAPPSTPPVGKVQTEHRPGLAASIRREPTKSPGMQPWDRWQTLTGLQYFFDTEFEIIDGRMYFSDSEWGLSSVAQHRYWSARPTLRRDGYQAVLSVDVGNATRPSSVTGKSFMESSEDEIACEVWRQMTTALFDDDAAIATTLPTPAWYAIDQNLVFEDGRIVENTTPYLVPIVDDWDNRPGGEPWKPGGPDMPSPELEDGVWQAGHGGAWVHFDSLVFAGTYLKTFTRLTTMESANESGRHAVNAILDHWLWERSGRTDIRQNPPSRWWLPEGTRGDFNSLPVRFPTPAGDYCFIRNTEYDEIPAFDKLRGVDHDLHAAGLPHPFVLSGIELGTIVSSHLTSKLLGGQNGGVLSPSLFPLTIEELLDKLVTYRSWLEQQFAPPTTGPPGSRGSGGTGGSAGTSSALPTRSDTEEQLIDALGLRPLVDWLDQRAGQQP